MTIAFNAGVENTIERFPHRSSTSTRALLSLVETVKSQIVQKSPRV